MPPAMKTSGARPPARPVVILPKALSQSVWSTSTATPCRRPWSATNSLAKRWAGASSPFRRSSSRVAAAAGGLAAAGGSRGRRRARRGRPPRRRRPRAGRPPRPPGRGAPGAPGAAGRTRPLHSASSVVTSPRLPPSRSRMLADLPPLVKAGSRLDQWLGRLPTRRQSAASEDGRAAADEYRRADSVLMLPEAVARHAHEPEEGDRRTG